MGLVNGRMQCQFTWWDKPNTPDPKLWFCDLYRKDQTPYDPQEIELIRRITRDKTIDFAARDYARPQPGPGEIPDTDPRLQYSEGWTAWRGGGPRFGTLHYHNTAGGRMDVGFEGPAVHLVYKVGPDCGLAQILIDGRPATAPHGGELKADAAGNAVLDMYGADVDWNHRVPIARGLRREAHVDGPCHRAEECPVLELLRTDRRRRRGLIGPYRRSTTSSANAAIACL